jgi:hypothetical protein
LAPSTQSPRWLAPRGASSRPIVQSHRRSASCGSFLIQSHRRLAPFGTFLAPKAVAEARETPGAEERAALRELLLLLLQLLLELLLSQLLLLLLLPLL